MKFSTYIRSLPDSAFSEIAECVLPERREPYLRIRNTNATLRDACSATPFFASPITRNWNLRHEWESAERLLRQRKEWSRKPPQGRLPNFLVLGTPRSATTWLHQTLSTHPDIFIAPMKEPEFFSMWRRFMLGENWYRHLFLDYGGERRAGEISVNNFFSLEAPQRIRTTIADSDLKLIVMLREPIDRALSHYKLRLQKGDVPSTFEKALDDPRLPLREEGHYIRYYRKYREVFPKDSIAVVLYEDVAKDARAVLQSICRFLDIDPSFFDQYASSRINESHTVAFVGLSRAVFQVGRWIRMVLPYGGIGAGIMRRLQAWNIRWNRKEGEMPLWQDTRRALEAEYAPENALLAKEAGIDLSAWKYT